MNKLHVCPNNNLSNIRVNFDKIDATTVRLEAYTEGNVDGISIKATKDKKLYMSGKFDGTWNPIVGLATEDDLPNIFTAQLGTSNLEGNHATTIKGLWNSFPKNQVFACNLVDSNNFCVFGFIYDDHKYGAVLYLAYNDCGIVKCNGGTFSDTKL